MAARESAATGATDIYQRSTQRLAAPAEQAAACISENAKRSGYAADTVPLYGMESLAVTVKTSATGDTVAVLSLTPAGAGSSAAVTTVSGVVTDRAEVVRRIVQGC
jgi:uncharacterized protein with ACT and thioredoxin-like domain